MSQSRYGCCTAAFAATAQASEKGTPGWEIRGYGLGVLGGSVLGSRGLSVLRVRVQDLRFLRVGFGV